MRGVASSFSACAASVLQRGGRGGAGGQEEGEASHSKEERERGGGRGGRGRGGGAHTHNDNNVADSSWDDGYVFQPTVPMHLRGWSRRAAQPSAGANSEQ
jgi:hypothetical protein